MYAFTYLLKAFGMNSDGPNGTQPSLPGENGRCMGKTFLRPNRLLFSLFYCSRYKISKHAKTLRDRLSRYLQMNAMQEHVKN